MNQLIKELSFDDPGQPIPNVAKSRNLYVYPGKSRKAWISAYFMKSNGRIGVYFRCENGQEGQNIFNMLSEDKKGIREELGNEVIWKWEGVDGPGVRLACDDVFESREKADDKRIF